jgi:hypothetical protein
MSSFTFGLASISDISALVKFTVKVGKTLYKPGETPADYEELLRELESVQKMLTRVRICKEQTMSQAAENCLESVLQEADTCEKLIHSLLEKRPCERTIDKMLWIMKGPSEAAEIRGKLSLHLQMTNTQLQLYVRGFQRVNPELTWLLGRKLDYCPNNSAILWQFIRIMSGICTLLFHSN